MGAANEHRDRVAQLDAPGVRERREALEAELRGQMDAGTYDPAAAAKRWRALAQRQAKALKLRASAATIDGAAQVAATHFERTAGRGAGSRSNGASEVSQKFRGASDLIDRSTSALEAARGLVRPNGRSVSMELVGDTLRGKSDDERPVRAAFRELGRGAKVRDHEGAVEMRLHHLEGAEYVRVARDVSNRLRSEGYRVAEEGYTSVPRFPARGNGRARAAAEPAPVGAVDPGTLRVGVSPDEVAAQLQSAGLPRGDLGAGRSGWFVRRRGEGIEVGWLVAGDGAGDRAEDVAIALGPRFDVLGGSNGVTLALTEGRGPYRGPTDETFMNARRHAERIDHPMIATTRPNCAMTAPVTYANPSGGAADAAAMEAAVRAGINDVFADGDLNFAPHVWRWRSDVAAGYRAPIVAGGEPHANEIVSGFQYDPRNRQGVDPRRVVIYARPDGRLRAELQAWTTKGMVRPWWKATRSAVLGTTPAEVRSGIASLVGARLQRGTGATMANHHGRPEEHAAGDPLGVYPPPLGEWRTYAMGQRMWTHPQLRWTFIVEPFAGKYIGRVAMNDVRVMTDRGLMGSLSTDGTDRSPEAAHDRLLGWYGNINIGDLRTADANYEFVAPYVAPPAGAVEYHGRDARTHYATQDNPTHPSLDPRLPAGAVVLSAGSPAGIVVVEGRDNAATGHPIVYYPSTRLHAQVRPHTLTVRPWPRESLPLEVGAFIYPTAGEEGWYDVNLVVAAGQNGGDTVASVRGVRGKQLARTVARRLAYGMVAQGVEGAQVFDNDELTNSYGSARRYLSEDPDAYATQANPSAPKLDANFPAGALVKVYSGPNLWLDGVITRQQDDNGEAGPEVYLLSQEESDIVWTRNLRRVRWAGLPSQVDVIVYASSSDPGAFDVNVVPVAAPFNVPDLMATTTVRGKAAALKTARRLAFGFTQEGVAGARVRDGRDVVSSYGTAEKDATTTHANPSVPDETSAAAMTAFEPLSAEDWSAIRAAHTGLRNRATHFGKESEIVNTSIGPVIVAAQGRDGYDYVASYVSRGRAYGGSLGPHKGSVYHVLRMDFWPHFPNGASAYGTSSNDGERFRGRMPMHARGRYQLALESDLAGLGYRVIPDTLAVAEGFDPRSGVPRGIVVTWTDGDNFVMAFPTMQEAHAFRRNELDGRGSVETMDGSPRVLYPVGSLNADDTAAWSARGRFRSWRSDRDQWLPADNERRREINPRFHGPQEPGHTRGTIDHGYVHGTFRNAGERASSATRHNGPNRLPPFAPGQDFEQLRRLDPERFAAVERAESSARLPPLAYGQGPYGGASSWSDAMYPDAGHGQLAGPTALRARFGRRGP